MRRYEYHVAAVSDAHCGRLDGLYPVVRADRESSHSPGEVALWDGFRSLACKLRRTHHVFTAGDMVQGESWRTRGTDLRVADCIEQAQLAARAFALEGVSVWLACSGTPAHSGRAEDYERLFAMEAGAAFAQDGCLWQPLPVLVSHLSGGAARRGAGDGAFCRLSAFAREKNVVISLTLYHQRWRNRITVKNARPWPQEPPFHSTWASSQWGTKLRGTG